MQVEEDLQNIENARHLREDEHSMAPLLALSKQSSQFLQLAAVILYQRWIWERDLQFDSDSVQSAIKVGVQRVPTE